jgi:crotonobetainyl-CoA:carnitine CoA-transferase CaiB-like acyl-CoA transferase
MGNAHFVHVPYDSFPTKDGHIIIAVITDGLWLSCLKALVLEELNLPEYARSFGRLQHRETIVQKITDKLRTQPSAYWLARLAENGVPCAPVNDINAALADPHVHARSMVVDVPLAQGGSVKQVGIPVKFSETGDDVFTPPPLLGADTEGILSSLAGVRGDALAALKEQGIV